MRKLSTMLPAMLHHVQLPGRTEDFRQGGVPFLWRPIPTLTKGNVPRQKPLASTQCVN